MTAPRPAVQRQHQALPHLQATFGQNRLLSVSNSTRALLEYTVADFDFLIRLACAYGSGVLKQAGYESGKGAHMPDFIFTVTHLIFARLTCHKISAMSARTWAFVVCEQGSRVWVQSTAN